MNEYSTTIIINNPIVFSLCITFVLQFVSYHDGSYVRETCLIIQLISYTMTRCHVVDHPFYPQLSGAFVMCRPNAMTQPSINELFDRKVYVFQVYKV